MLCLLEPIIQFQENVGLLSCSGVLKKSYANAVSEGKNDHLCSYAI